MASASVSSAQVKQSIYVDPTELRTAFSLAMSSMYQKEVPLYGDLIRIVKATNEQILATSSDSNISALRNGGNLTEERLELERHGAIRLGTPKELQTVRRLFAVIGLRAVGYYDLSVAGLPIHATCFRSVESSALKRNPFRVFTTLLRPELVADFKARELTLSLLGRRNIFSDKLLELISTHEKQGGLTTDQADLFVVEAMKTFSWQATALATEDEYLKLKSENPILADIACFQSAHINHLTPRTLNINAAQEAMKAEGMAVKERIEGPPVRDCPILLRQTSFLALEEKIMFPQSLSTGDASGSKVGTHRARFGEIEERGAAVTHDGRALYNKLLEEVMSLCQDPGELDNILAEAFKVFPDTWTGLRKSRLVYFTFRSKVTGPLDNYTGKESLEELIERGVMEATPITYEDFLPLSAAGIFQSNLQSRKNAAKPSLSKTGPDLDEFQSALGCSVLDSDYLYAEAQRQSLRQCEADLGLKNEALKILYDDCGSQQL